MRIDIKDEVKGLSSYKEYKKITKLIQERFDGQKIRSEITGMHASRLTRNLTAKKANPKNVIEANTRDIAYRSRFLEILIELYTHKAHLAKATLVVKRDMIVRFGTKISLKTRTDRSLYFDRFLRAGEDVLDEIELLIKMIDLYIKDIDQGGYAIRNVVELVDKIYSKERTI